MHQQFETDQSGVSELRRGLQGYFPRCGGAVSDFAGGRGLDFLERRRYAAQHGFTQNGYPEEFNRAVPGPVQYEFVSLSQRQRCADAPALGRANGLSIQLFSQQFLR